MSVKAWPKTQLKNAEQCEGCCLDWLKVWVKKMGTILNLSGVAIEHQMFNGMVMKGMWCSSQKRNKTNGFLCSDSLGTTLSNLLVNLVIMHASKFLPQLFSVWARAARKQGYSRIQPDTVKWADGMLSRRLQGLHHTFQMCRFWSHDAKSRNSTIWRRRGVNITPMLAGHADKPCESLRVIMSSVTYPQLKLTAAVYASVDSQQNP